MTDYDASILTVAEDYRRILEEDESSSSETYFNNLSDLGADQGEDSKPPTQDYYDLILMINMVNDLIDDSEFDGVTCSKMMNLHLDAAGTAGVSTGAKLYSPRELYHLALAEYYESRLDGADHKSALALAIDQHSNLKQYNRVILGK